jgi:hypothetical protein
MSLLKSLALLCCALPVFAHAAHPLVSDDTRTQDQGNHQVELNADWQRISGEHSRIAAATYAVGVRPELDLYANLPVTLSSPSGRNDLSIGAKWRFWEAGKNALALKPELFLPTGNERKGLGDGRTGLGVTMLASHESGPWFLFVNLGLAWHRYRLPDMAAESRRAIWRASAAAMLAVTDRVSIMADAGVERDASRVASDHPAFLVLGVIVSPTRDVDLDFGIKFVFKAAEGERQAGAGLTIRF